MTVFHTPNLQLPYPDGNEAVDLGPEDFQGIVQILDSGSNGPTVTRVLSGVLSGLPAASGEPFGTLYQCTDVQAWFLRNASGNWSFLPLGGGQTPIGGGSVYFGTSDPVDPDGVKRWMIADGRSLSKTTYSQAFAVFGTTFGSSGSTFNLPNTQGRFMLGAASSGAYSGIGRTGGSLGHTHTTPAITVPGLSIPVLTASPQAIPSLTAGPQGIPSLGINPHAHTLGSGFAMLSIGQATFALDSDLSTFYTIQGGTFNATNAYVTPNVFGYFNVSGYPPGDGQTGLWGIQLDGTTDLVGGSTIATWTEGGVTSTGYYTEGGSTGASTTGGATVPSGTTGPADPAYMTANWIVRVL